MFHIENVGRSSSTTFAVLPFGGEYKPIKITARIFMLALTDPEIIRFEMFDLENLGQGHGVQHSQ